MEIILAALDADLKKKINPLVNDYEKLLKSEGNREDKNYQIDDELLEKSYEHSTD